MRLSLRHERDTRSSSVAVLAINSHRLIFTGFVHTMRNRKFHVLGTVAAAAAASLIAIAATAQALPGAQTPNPVPDQAGVVYPGRVTTQPPPVAAPQANPQLAPPVAAVVPPAGTPLPGQARTANGSPAMPPLAAGVGPRAPKSGPALAVDDTLPEGLGNQVRELRLRMDEVQRAAAANPAPAARPVTRSQAVTQAAGEEPPAVRTTLGVPTNLVFVDVTGAPWPVEFATPGDSNQFDVLLPVPGTSNVQIRPKQPYAYGGLSVTLKDNSVPISIILTTAQREVDTRVDMRVMQRGPNAKAALVDRVVVANSAAADAALVGFLDGVAPAGAREVRTSLQNVKAWSFNGQLYLRTDTTLVSPLWTDSLSSPNGVTRTYLLGYVPSVVVSMDGSMVPVSIGE